MTNKLTKPEVDYRKATSSRRCGNCSMFERSWSAPGEGKCTLVEGVIEARDVCDRWERLCLTTRSCPKRSKVAQKVLRRALAALGLLAISSVAGWSADMCGLKIAGQFCDLAHWRIYSQAYRHKKYHFFGNAAAGNISTFNLVAVRKLVSVDRPNSEGEISDGERGERSQRQRYRVKGFRDLPEQEQHDVINGAVFMIGLVVMAILHVTRKDS